MILSIIAFVVAFGILVLVHEFGHFWVAKKAGIAVEKFSIGFGPRILGFKWGETDCCVSLLPLGGFVKMKGEGDEDEVSPEDKTAFPNKSVLARSCVVLAGPMMNLLLSFALMPFVFWIGKPEVAFLKEAPVIERIVPGSPAEKSGFQIGDRIVKLDGKPISTWETFLEPLALTAAGQKLEVEIQRKQATKTVSVETVSLPGGEGVYLGIEKFFGKAPDTTVKEVVSGSPADHAGIQVGDKIKTIEGKKILNWDSLIKEVNAHGSEALTIAVTRQQSELALHVQPQWDDSAKRWLLGIRGPENLNLGMLQTRVYSFKEAVKVGFKANVKNIGLTFQVLKKLITLKLSYKSLGGPVQIAYTLGKASAAGLADFLYFIAFLSVQLAILNILPIPMLDGGHLLFFGIEAIRRRPLSLRTRTISQQVGMVLLLTLILFVTFNDLERLLGLSQWLQKIFH